MLNRVIKSSARSSSMQLTECLNSLMAIELMHPSLELYLISPWISNMPLIKSQFGQFRAIMGELGKSELRLADVMTILAERGTKVCIMCRPDQSSTDDFLRRLPSNLANIEVRQTGTLHEKGLISQYFYLRGSMNFTYSGISFNDESIELTTEPELVGNALIEARLRWENLAL
ncbi:MAG: hypothetical protein HXX20_00035 [Chloroflexi bacterium]|nr:hypothetical protein [Chloroflexota bacterium]